MTELPDDLSEFEAHAENIELRKTLAKLQGQLKKSKAKTEDLIQAAHDGAKEAALILGNPPEVPVPKKDKRTGREEMALLHLSDWQLGKRTDTYNSAVAIERLGQLGDKVVELTQIERAAHPVRVCHVMLGGDLVEGTSIFPGQVYEIDSTLYQQAFNATGCLERLIRQLLATFEQVHCWEVLGNHGRLGRKGDVDRGDNSDRFVYELTRRGLGSGLGEFQGRLIWHEHYRFYQIVEVGNYKALLVHGDQVKSFGGNTPAFGISRKVNGWAAGVLDTFEDCYMGHFHQPLVLPLANGRRRTFLNPSIESDSAYAQEFVAATGAPGQRLHFIDPEKGQVTTERILWLD